VAYHGFKPAEQAIQIGADEILSSHISDGVIVNADVNASAAIATSKVSGAVTSIGSHGLGSLATLSAIASAQITDGTIVNADVNNSAAIVTSKLSGSLTSVGSHGLATSATTDTTNASNISSGTLAAARVATLNQSTTGQAGTVATIAGLAPNTATTQATQGAITSTANLVTVGTITTGVWNAGAVTSSGGISGTTGAFTDNVALTSADTWEPQLTITNTNNNANPGQLQFWKRPADSSEADNDILGQIGFAGLNDANADTWYQTMYVKALDVSDGSEDFGFYMDGHVAGVGDTNVFKIESGKATFSGQCQADSFITGDLILKSPTNNGHYTIWEEEEYLAIRNEMTGKKYKFVLEEIDE
jgi:hypothetical protein